MIKITKKPTKPIKNKKKLDTKDTPMKKLVEGDEFKKLQRKAKRFGAKSLDYSNRKNNKYLVEYEGKKIHFGSTKYEDYLIPKILVEEKSIWQKQRKSQTKMVISLMILHHFQIIGQQNF